ncbi:MAG: hypothetical protein JSW41_04845 [Candidatus Aenigmatarchaeota archaeon]|nr:MAG: hypothetical protein JSW41_04845 [Candidatus Aenigmarchaeota archaeon]
MTKNPYRKNLEKFERDSDDWIEYANAFVAWNEGYNRAIEDALNIIMDEHKDLTSYRKVKDLKKIMTIP